MCVPEKLLYQFCCTTVSRAPNQLCDVLHVAGSCFALLPFTVLPFAVLHSDVLHCGVLRFVVVQFAVLHVAVC